MKNEQEIRKYLWLVVSELENSPAPDVVLKNLLEVERNLLMWVLDEEKTDG